MRPSFHLSLGVRSVEESARFFTDVLGATVVHRDPAGYVNLDLFGTQLTLAAGNVPEDPEFHFGVNLDQPDFDQIVVRLSASNDVRIVSGPHVVDPGTPLERTKMYLKCPSGYLIELKGFRNSSGEAARS